MKILVKNITDIIVAEVNSINDKVKGLNFLELLKVNLIEKCLPLINELNFPLEENLDIKKDIEKNISISIQYFANSLSISKKKIDYDSLFVSFNEATNFDIYKNEKKNTSIVLYKNCGVSLPMDTIVNFSYNKNVFLLKIQNKNIEQALTK